MPGSTKDYSKKRDFTRTPEPAPGTTRENQRSFVVHRHESRRLHYDLRMEAEGALACWAVPKGFSYDPSDKRLAVKTEDHPLEYEEFSGVIPRGEYGAGTMLIWDSGTYEVVKTASIEESLESGEVKVILHGQRLRGEWHLVKTRGKADWLLFKAKDRYAGSGAELLPQVNLGMAKRRSLLRRPQMMEAIQTEEPFTDRDWVFEMVFEGRRVIAVVEDDHIVLRSRAGGDMAPQVPGVCRSLKRLRSTRFAADGVLVALDGRSRPSATALESELANGGEGVNLYLFDLLYTEEWDLRLLPLSERKMALRSILPESGTVLFVDHVVGEGESLAETARAAGIPAIVGKRASAPYAAGPKPDWRQIPLNPAETNADFHQALARSRKGRKGGSRRLKISNPGKVYWPDEGYTKRDLVAHYERVSDLILPYLTDRPIHMYRWPDGITGKSFYQKQLPSGIPDWVDRTDVARAGEESSHYIVCNNHDTLLYMINLGSIDLHPWLSRRDNLDSPDWAIIDLDPKQAPFGDVVKVAREVGKILRGVGLRPFLKTSGSSGLHIYVPLIDGYTYEHARMFCEGIARLVVRNLGEIATVERNIAQRRRRVYIDYLQNRREQTIVPPYVVRPVPGATVSTPLDWDELDGDMSIADFDIKTTPDRLANVGDIFHRALDDRQDLLPAIEALQNYLS